MHRVALARVTASLTTDRASRTEQPCVQFWPPIRFAQAGVKTVLTTL